MKLHKIILPALLAFILNFPAQAQDYEKERQVEQYMKEARSLMKRGQYEEANSVFRKILALKTVIPTNMCYLFAETLFMIGQYENSKNFLDKYDKLAGKAGDFSEQSVHLRSLLDDKLSVIKTCNLCDYRGYVYQQCNTCKGAGSFIQKCHYCKGKGLVQCNVCKGEGVAISKNKMGGNEYRSCTKCDSKGYANCHICDGSKEYEDYCRSCLGTAKLPGKTICKHEANP